MNNVPYLRSTYNLPAKVKDEVLMALQHFRGLGGSKVYLKALMETKDYNKAQQALDDFTLRELKKKNPKATLPKNLPVIDYINKFI
jgi:hypothetical protein